MRMAGALILLIVETIAFISIALADPNMEIQSGFQTSDKAEVTARIIDVYFMTIDGSNWHIWPFPLPSDTGLENYPAFWEYSLENQNVELQFKSLGPHDLVDIWTGEPFDASPNELLYNATMGIHWDRWLADIRDTPGNYSTEQSFEIWLYRLGENPRRLDSASFAFLTDADPPVTNVLPQPSTVCVSGSKFITLNWSGVDVGPAGIWRYDLQYRIDNGQWLDIPGLRNTPKISAQFQVLAGHTYYFRCRGKDRFADPSLFTAYPQSFIETLTARHTESYPDGDGDAHIAVKQFPPAPDQLGLVPDPACVGDQYCVSWQSVTGASAYEIREDNSDWINVGNARKAYYIKTDNGSHQYVVRARNECGPGFASQPLTVDIYSVPDASTIIPSVLPQMPIIGENFVISWSSVAGASSYLLFENDIKIDSSPETSKEFIKASYGAFRYAIEACNSCGCGSRSNPRIVDIALGTKETELKELPSEFILEQNHPNPFNPTTEIGFDLPKACYALIEVFDITGRKIAIPVSQNFSAGRYIARWDGSDMDGSPVPSGIYFYRLKADNYSSTKKMILLK